MLFLRPFRSAASLLATALLSFMRTKYLSFQLLRNLSPYGGGDLMNLFSKTMQPGNVFTFFLIEGVFFLVLLSMLAMPTKWFPLIIMFLLCVSFIFLCLLSTYLRTYINNIWKNYLFLKHVNSTKGKLPCHRNSFKYWISNSISM